MCSNCLTNNLRPVNHAATDKKCPVFIKQQELQAIKTTYKINNYAAKQLYDERHQHDATSYSTITKPLNPTKTPTQVTKNPTNKETLPSSSRKLITYEDTAPLISPIKLSTQPKTTSNDTIILPRKTLKRLRSQLKKINGKQTPSTDNNAKNLNNTETSESDVMDYSPIEQLENTYKLD